MHLLQLRLDAGARCIATLLVSRHAFAMLQWRSRLPRASPSASSFSRRNFDQRDNPRSDDQDTVTGVYLPTDRSLSRAMTRARERLADHEYHEALAFLQGILAREEDSFLERAGDDRRQLGLKATARQLIGELPPEGHDAYELLQARRHAASSKPRFKMATATASPTLCANTFTRRPDTKRRWCSAQMEADQGHRLAAAQLYQELIDTPRAADRVRAAVVRCCRAQSARGRPAG